MSQKQIDREITSKVADLIKIKLSEAEIAEISEKLNTVLESVEVLSEVDTEGVEETSQTHGLENVLRADDEVLPGLDMKSYKNTRNFKDGYFVIKR